MDCQGCSTPSLTAAAPDRVGNGIYLLANPDYGVMAGNLSAWPKSPERQGIWLSFPIEARRFGDQKGERTMAQALTVDLRGGYHLLVGQNTAPQRRMQIAIIQALVLSLAAMVCLGLAGGLLLSCNMVRQLRRSIQAPSESCGARSSTACPSSRQ